MHLLILTQTLDSKDGPLGFFHRWVEELARRVDSVLVFALKTGEHHLAQNVSVERLRATKERAPATTALRTLALAWRYRNSYDAVFVHMNQEYLLVAGWLWKLLGKRVYMWRNHYAGNFLTDIAALFCDKVFYTSKSSYTAKYKRGVQMPVGVDVDMARSTNSIVQKSHSVLSFGRLDPSKRPDLIVEALGILAKEGVPFSATIAGGPSEQNSTYPAQLKTNVRELGIEDKATFVGAVPNDEKYDLFRSHEVYVNASRSGMLDKITFEAIACGCLPLYASADMVEIAGPEFSYPYGDAAALAERLKTVLAFSSEKRATVTHALQQKIAFHTLPVLADKLIVEIA